MQIMTAAGKRYFSLFINITILTTQKEKFPPESAVTVSSQDNHVITAWLTAIMEWRIWVFDISVCIERIIKMI